MFHKLILKAYSYFIPKTRVFDMLVKALEDLVVSCEEILLQYKESVDFDRYLQFRVEYVRSESIDILQYINKFNSVPIPVSGAYTFMPYGEIVIESKYSSWFLLNNEEYFLSKLRRIPQLYDFLINKKTYDYWEFLRLEFRRVFKNRHLEFDKFGLLHGGIRKRKGRRFLLKLRYDCLHLELAKKKIYSTKKISKIDLFRIEKLYGIIFPKSIFDLYLGGIPIIGDEEVVSSISKLPNWYDFSAKNQELLRFKLEYPDNCVKLFHSNFLKNYGKFVPHLIPINENHYVPSMKIRNPPVFSIWLSEVKIIKASVTDYINISLLEKQSNKKGPIDGGAVGEYIPFWSDLAASQKLRKEEFYKEWAHFDEN